MQILQIILLGIFSSVALKVLRIENFPYYLRLAVLIQTALIYLIFVTIYFQDFLQPNPLFTLPNIALL